MHTIEFDGGQWKITADTGESWAAPTETGAADSLAEWIAARAEQDQAGRLALPEGVFLI